MSPCLPVSFPVSPSFLPPSIPSLSPSPFLFHFLSFLFPLSYMFFHFFFTDFIISCIYQGGERGYRKKKWKEFLLGKENVHTWVLLQVITLLLVQSVASIIFVHSFLKPESVCVSRQTHVQPWTKRGKVGKGPISGTSYLQKHFQICQETVCLQLNKLN